MSGPSPKSRRVRRRASAATSGAPTSLADAQFTTTQQRLLALLFGQPSRSYFATELIGLIGSGSGAVQRELERLTSSGLVDVSLVGKRKLYRANHQSPVYESRRVDALRPLDSQSARWRHLRRNGYFSDPLA